MQNIYTTYQIMAKEMNVETKNHSDIYTTKLKKYLIFRIPFQFPGSSNQCLYFKTFLIVLEIHKLNQISSFMVSGYDLAETVSGYDLAETN